MPDIINVEFHFAVDTKAAWSATNVPLPNGFVAYISDEHNAKKVGNGIDLFEALPYHGTTSVMLASGDIPLTHVYPKSFMIVESDTHRVRFPDGVTAYQNLPYLTMRNRPIDSPLNTTALSSAEIAAMRSIIDDISTVELNASKNITISAQTIIDAFTAQSLDIADYSLLMEYNTKHTLDHAQLILMMIKSVSDRLAIIEDALL